MNLPKKTIDKQLISKLNEYLQSTHKYLSRLGLLKIMIGIYGDINCLIAVKLLKQALGENVVAMVFDFGTTSTNTLVEFCRSISVTSYVLKRDSLYRHELSSYGLNKPSDISRFQKRFINYHLQIQAEHMKAGIADIQDKSERLVGTRPEGFYGHFAPFYSFYKSEICDLGQFLDISLNPPVYENYSWEQIDPVLYMLTQELKTPEEIAQNCSLDIHFIKKIKSRTDKQPLISTPSQFII